MYGNPTAAQGDALLDDGHRAESAKGSAGVRPYGTSNPFEHNRRLATKRAAVTAERICLRHPAVMAGLDVWLQGMHIPTATVEPATHPNGERNAAHVAACLGIGCTSPIGTVWPQLFEELLTVPLFGFGVWETVAEQAGGVWYTGLRWRDPASVSEWVVDERDRLVAVKQVPVNGWAANATDIPMSQALHMAWRPTGPTDFDGTGMLRAVEPEVSDATALAQLSIVTARRWSVPYPEVIVNRQAALNAGETEATIKTALTAVDADCARLAAHQQAFIRHDDWLTVGVFGNSVGNMYEFQAAIDASWRRILQVFAAGLLMLGSAGSGGSYNLAEVMLSVRNDHAAGVLDWLSRSLAPFIARAVRWQFGPDEPVEAMPRLRFDGLASEVFWDKLTDLPALVAAGLIRVDDNLRDALRQAGEMPPEDPENRPPAPVAAVQPAPPRGMPAPMPAGGVRAR